MVVTVSVDPTWAVDTLIVGQGPRAIHWRSSADWREIDKVTVRPDSIFKWDVSAGDNLSPSLLLRDGRLQAMALFVNDETLEEELVEVKVEDLALLIDGDGSTAFDPDEAVGHRFVGEGIFGTWESLGEAGVPRDVIILIDLGASFSINRIRLYPRLEDEHRILFPQRFAVSTSDGEAMLDGPYTPVPGFSFNDVLPNVEPIVDRPFTSRQARYVQIRMGSIQPWELAEIEIYGDGSLPVGQYQSRALPSRPSFPVWGRVSTDIGDISDLPVVMQTRTGPDPRPIDIQFRLRFSEPGTIIRTLFIEYSGPGLVERLQAEVDPRIVDPGIEQELTLSLLSNTIAQGRNRLTGFRQLEILTQATVSAVEEVLVDDIPHPFSAVVRPGQGFTVNLGRRIQQDGTFIQIRFRATMFRDATSFDTRVVDRRLTDGRFETVYQTAEAADIDLVSPGGELVVRFRSNENLSIVGNVRLSSSTVTPNGDDINDVTRLSFALLKLTRPVEATFDIYDLQGRRTRGLMNEALGDGHHEVSWDGTDEHGVPVPPGTYVYRLTLDGDEGRVVRQGVVGVVY